jgi:hypothetical protein
VSEGGGHSIHVESAAGPANRSSLDISFEGGQQSVSTTVTVTFALGG